ncbi:MAG TPA: hypothetical protein VFP86_15715 [bacterium]|nr:hypothetical protein [bacterium]
MRLRLASSLCGVLLLAASVPASAEPTLRSVTDPNGRYSISFPTSWEIVSMNATPLAGEIVSQMGKNLFSMLMAIDPGASRDAPTVLMVMGMPLERALSPRTFGMITGESMGEKLEGYALVKEGTATIAKRPAFYRYFTMAKQQHELYSVMVYFTVDKTGYMIFGATPNQPETVRKSFGDISQILESFRPTGK